MKERKLAILGGNPVAVYDAMAKEIIFFLSGNVRPNKPELSCCHFFLSNANMARHITDGRKINHFISDFRYGVISVRRYVGKMPL